jgi:peptide/nickel transport system substrate-binding protein
MLLRAVAAVAAITIVAAGCGDDSGGSNETGGAATSAAPTTTSPPVKGGTLTIGTFSEAPGLDPNLTSGAGTTYGMEVAAIYDRLIQWDPIAKKYLPRLAESYTSNATFTEWTLKIRSGVKFADGTPYDAEAVKFNFDRSKTSNAVLRGPLANMKEVTVVDPLTVKVTLTDPWPGFVVLLGSALGMIISPTAVKAAGAGFATNPVNAGAGPFQFASLKPKEALVLKRNPNYWGGEVYLDELRFVFLGGASATYEALKSGSIDVAFLREAIAVDQAKKDGMQGFSTVMSMGEMILINAGAEVTCSGGKPEPVCAGQADGAKIATKTPGTNKKVRQAVQAAIDLAGVDQRANNGKGIVATSIYDQSFPWNPNVMAPKQNVDQAKKLVQEAKAEGWDGKIRLSCTNTPQRQGTALAVQAMLNSVGIDVDMTRANLDVNQVIADVITNKNYDLACWGLAASPDDYTFTQLDSFLRSTSGSNRSGYKSAAMDAALDETKRASTDAEKTAGYKKIAEAIVADAPFVAIGHAEERLVMSAKVHGAVPTAFTTADFSKAFKS